MTTASDYWEDLKRLRDEIELKIQLGSMDLKDEWERLEKKWAEFVREAELEKTAKEVGEAVRGLAAELREGYERLRKAL